MWTSTDPDVVVCTAADSGYFDLLRDLVRSLRQRAQALPHVLAVLDLGLTPDQQDWLRQQGARLVEPGWDVEFPSRSEQPGHFRSQIVRAFLPRHCPGFQTYIWLDADTWVQDGAVLHWLVQGAADGRMALVEEMHSAYKKIHDQRELSQKALLIQRYYGAADAERYGLTPSLNSGVFALRADAPHWAVWGQEIAALLQQDPTRFVDQMALERTIHAHRLPACYLPARANWLVSQAIPAFCPQRGMLVDPLPPHDPLWILHLALGAKDLTLIIPMLGEPDRELILSARLSEIGPLVGLG